MNTSIGIGILTVTIVFGVACQTAGENEASPQAVPARESAIRSELDGFRDQAEQRIQQFQSELQERLQKAMAAGGPPHAIDVCSTDAPQIAKALSTPDMQLRRVGTRVRNKKTNTPTAAEKNALVSLNRIESTFLGRLDGQPTFMRAIFLDNPVCLTCHGPLDVIPSQVRERLGERYADDEAVNYALGDLRGAFVAWSPAAIAPPVSD